MLRNHLNEQDWTLNVKRLKGSQKTLQVIYPNGIKLFDERKALLEWLAERPAGEATSSQSTRSTIEPNLGVPDLQEARGYPAGLPAHKSAPHALKHSLGQDLHDSGQPIEVVAACLGHTRIDSSRRYFEVSFADVNHARRAAIAFQS